MKFPIQSVVTGLAWLYKTFLKGRVVKVGGQDVTLPSQGNVPPLRGSQFDSKPHQPNSGPAPWGPRR
jgi:hypothetical protein